MFRNIKREVRRRIVGKTLMGKAVRLAAVGVAARGMMHQYRGMKAGAAVAKSYGSTKAIKNSGWARRGIRMEISQARRSTRNAGIARDINRVKSLGAKPLGWANQARQRMFS